ncbi:MAG: histidine phosphatase family protein [Gemmatimonas sp.]
MSVRLHFLRHGQTPSSRDNVFCGAGLDPELTPDGVEMASAFASTYRDRTWKAIYSGPLRRTLSTAVTIAHATTIPVTVRAGLVEIAYGLWEGRSTEEVDRDFHDEYVRWTADPAWNAPTGGETAIALAQRMLHVVEEITMQHEQGDVLVVSHKASIRAVVCALIGVDVGRFRYRLGCPVGSLTVVEFGAHGPLAASVADRSHLDARLRSLPGT